MIFDRVSKLNKFKKWLVQQGADILPLTNEYELLRFKGKSVGVIYKSGKYSGEYASQAVSEWQTGKNWSGRPDRVTKGPSKTAKNKILDRDGDCCFYCNEPLEDNITIEHLLSRTAGGSNRLGNLVLAHKQCNEDAGNLPLVKKVDIRVQNMLDKAKK